MNVLTYQVKVLISKSRITKALKPDTQRTRAIRIIKLMGEYINFTLKNNLTNKLKPKKLDKEFSEQFNSTMTKKRAKEFVNIKSNNWNIVLNDYESKMFQILLISFPKNSQLYSLFSKKLSILSTLNQTKTIDTSNLKIEKTKDALEWINNVKNIFFEPSSDYTQRTGLPYSIFLNSTGLTYPLKESLYNCILIMSFPELFIFIETVVDHAKQYKTNLERIKDTITETIQNLDGFLKNETLKNEIEITNTFKKGDSHVFGLEYFIQNSMDNYYSNMAYNFYKTLKEDSEDFKYLDDFLIYDKKVTE